MPKNAIKREGRVNFWKNIDYKKPETRPEPVMSNPNPTRTRRNISKPDPTRTRKKFQNPNLTRTWHLATRPITKREWDFLMFCSEFIRISDILFRLEFYFTKREKFGLSDHTIKQKKSTWSCYNSGHKSLNHVRCYYISIGIYIDHLLF